MKTTPANPDSNYRAAYAKLVAEYNSLCPVKRSTTIPTDSHVLRESVRVMADTLSYTDSEMRDLGVAWHE